MSMYNYSLFVMVNHTYYVRTGERKLQGLYYVVSKFVPNIMCIKYAIFTKHIIKAPVITILLNSCMQNMRLCQVVKCRN